MFELTLKTTENFLLCSRLWDDKNPAFLWVCFSAPPDEFLMNEAVVQITQWSNLHSFPYIKQL